MDSSQDDDKGGYRQMNKALKICVFVDYLNGQIANLPHLPNTEPLTPRVLRVLSQNPGKFTFQGTNAFVIGTGVSQILVDTSGGKADVCLKYLLVTHWHGDHSEGIPDLVRMLPHLRNHIYKNDPKAGQQNITDGQVFQVEGATVTAVHAPGHSHDHIGFVPEEEKAIFTCDDTLGHGTSAVEDLGLFMSSIPKIAGKNCVIGHPAHGVTIEDLHGKMSKELASKGRREKQVMGTLKRLRDRGDTGAGITELVTGNMATACITTRVHWPWNHSSTKFFVNLRVTGELIRDPERPKTMVSRASPAKQFVSDESRPLASCIRALENGDILAWMGGVV